MQKRTRLTPHLIRLIPSRFYRGVSFFLLTLMLFSLVFGDAQMLFAGASKVTKGYALPDGLSSRRPAASQAEANTGPEASEAQVVEYAPLNTQGAEGTAVDDAAPSSTKLKGPAEKAAERAHAYRISLAGQEAASQKSGAEPEQPVSDQEPGDDAMANGKSLEATVAVGSKSVVPDKALNFEECVFLALKQSPYFVESAMQVQLNRIDESDSWYQLLPKFLVSTGYVVTGPNIEDSDRFSLSFSTGSYDPIAAGFSIQATKLVTEVAILVHMKTINKGLFNLGKMFLELSYFDRSIVLQEELVALAKHEKTYLSNLLKTGGTNPLEVRIAEQQVEMALLERESLEAKRDELFEDLKIFLGLGIEDELQLDLQDADDQVLGFFSPSHVTIADVHANSIDLKIQKQRRELQEYNIKLAWANYLPKIYFQARTADPIDKDDADDGLYTSVGFTWTLWDWGERYRNVRRQRMNTRQEVVKENLQELDLTSDWRSGLANRRSSLASMKVAKAEVELAGLRKRQGEISYQAGTQPFPVYLDQIREYFLARKSALDKELDDESAMFDLRYMSGDLFNTYINAQNF